MRCGVLATVVMAAGVSGCSVLSPMPTLELIKASGLMAGQYISNQASTHASDTVRHPHAVPGEVCIEINRITPLIDVLPALQRELAKHQVGSRVFEAATPAQVCPVWLHYAVAIDWAQPAMSDDYQPYISRAVLTLRADDGRVLASSAYAQDQAFGMGRWATTQAKLAPVVKALLTGVDG